MLKRFSPHSIILDGEVDGETLENWMVCDLDRYQIAVETDEQMKEHCYPLFKQGADAKNMTIDEYYDYLAKKYPYNGDFSYWRNMTDKEKKIFGERFMQPMKRDD